MQEKNYRNPKLTVDIIIELKSGFIMIKRRNKPYGWALPGGFVDYGESLESAAIREAKEETSLDIILTEQFLAYSDPERDPRHHTVSVVFIGEAIGKPVAADDAVDIAIFNEKTLPKPIVFDHWQIIENYILYKSGTSKKTIFKESFFKNGR